MAAIDTAAIGALIQDGYSDTFLGKAAESSATLSAFPTVDLGTKTTILPVLASDPEARWVAEYEDAAGDNSAAELPTSKVSWADKKIVAEALGVIIPVPNDQIADANEDLLTEVTKKGGEALGKKLDSAVLSGTAKPATWTTNDLKAAAVASGQALTYGVDGDSEDLRGAIYDAEGLLSGAGFEDPVIVARRSLRSTLRNERDANGAFLGTANDFLADFDPTYTKRMPSGITVFVVDRSSIRVGIRQDIEVDVLDQATLTGVGNLAELRMKGISFNARYGYVLKEDAAVASIAPAPAAG